MPEGVAYIYIMTNKTFEGHDWVKIGYATDVERRRKELSTTNLPFGYEIYATYEIPQSAHMGDKALHKLITKLNPSLRLAPNREFFAMSPEDAYDLLQALAVIHNREDKLVRGPATQKEVPAKKQPALNQPSSYSEFLIKIQGKVATLVAGKDGFILKAGSAVKINSSENNPERKEQDKDLKDGLLSSPVQGVSVLESDKLFPTPSKASKYVCGYSCNGRRVWKTRDGRSLGEALGLD